MPAASEVFCGRNRESIVIDSTSVARRCFVLAETGTFATNSPLGNVAFSEEIAVEFGSPRVIAETDPQEAIVIVAFFHGSYACMPSTLAQKYCVLENLRTAT